MADGSSEHVRRRVNASSTPTDGIRNRKESSAKDKSENVVDTPKVYEEETRPSKLKAWVTAFRPHTLTASVAPVIVGYALTSHWHDEEVINDGSMSIDMIAYGFASFAILIQLGTNAHNDYADFVKGTDTDERVGHARATQKGWLSPFETALGSTIMLVFASFIGMHFVKESSAAQHEVLGSGGFDWTWTFVTISSVFNAVAYTGGPFPLGYIGLGNISIGYSGLGDLFVMIYFGFVATMGVPYLYLRIICKDASPLINLMEHGLMRRAFVLAGPVGCLATAIIVVNNLRDRHTDIRTRKMTLAVRFGDKFSRQEYAFLLIFSYAILIPLAVKCSPYYLLPLLSIPIAIPDFKAVALKEKDGSDLNAHVGGTAKLQFFFCLFLSTGIKLSSTP